MNTQWEDVKKGVREGLSTAAEKVELMARIGKVKLDISTIKRNIGKAEKQLGRYVYDLVTIGKSKIAEDEKVKGLVEKISILEGDLKEKQALLEQINQEKEQKKEKVQEVSVEQQPE